MRAATLRLHAQLLVRHRNNLSLTSHYGFSTSCMMPTRTHRMARVFIWLALLLAGVAIATTVEASTSGLGDSTIAGELRQVPTVSAHAIHNLAVTHHQHDEHAPCPHGMCGQCCPFCSAGAVGFGLLAQPCPIIGHLAASKRYRVATAELPHAWLSQLPFRPPI